MALFMGAGKVRSRANVGGDGSALQHIRNTLATYAAAADARKFASLEQALFGATSEADTLPAQD